MGRLKGKRILVAGSARNIGAKTAERLVEEGAQVFLGDVDGVQVKAVADQLGAGSQWFDLADPESLENLVSAAAKHLGGLDGIVNVAADISPGMIVTETAGDLVTEEYMNKILRGMPLPRLGESKDIANGIVFFMSDEAEWITGQVLNINGGAAYRD